MKNIPLYAVDEISTLRDMLVNSEQKFGSKTAFLRKIQGIEDYVPVTYSQYKNDVEAFGTKLMEMGLKGKRVAIIGENRYEWSVSYLSVVNGMGIVVPLDKELPSNEILLSLNRAKVSAIIFSPKIADKVFAIIKDVPSIEFVIIMDDTVKEPTSINFWDLHKEGLALVASGNKSFIEAEIDTEEMSILLFTSGTTDTTKAVMLSHKNICQNLMAMTSMLYIDDKDIFLSLLPIHHTYECTCGFLCAIYRGGTVAYCEGLRYITKNMAEAKVTIILGVPLIFESMYKKVWDNIEKNGLTKKVQSAIKINNFLKKFGIDLSKKLFAKIHQSFGGHIRIFISGAAGIDPAIAAGFRAFGILTVQGYGLTECAPIAALNRSCDYKDDSAGLPLPGLKVEIDNPNEENIGEFKVKGPSVMIGYYNDEEATNRVIKDGWFYTGDLGFIDSDGFVHITGRKKNVIITKNGKNIYPEEIETLLLKSPYIEEVVVYGEETDDDIIVKALVYANSDKIAEDVLNGILESADVNNTVHEEIKKVNKQLSGYKAVKGFSLKDIEFEKTTTKKIKRYVSSNKV